MSTTGSLFAMNLEVEPLLKQMCYIVKRVGVSQKMKGLFTYETRRDQAFFIFIHTTQHFNCFLSMKLQLEHLVICSEGCQGDRVKKGSKDEELAT